MAVTGTGARVPHVVCAPDKFRNALGARDAAAVMAAGARQAGWTATSHPIADGGEGSREAVAASRGGETREVAAEDPWGRPVRAPYLVTEDGTAVVVAADVIGLEPLPEAERDPMRCTSRGLAAPLLAAAADGVRRIVVFVGGVATVDGGLGLLAALGAAPADREGRDLLGTGADLEVVERLDLQPARAALDGIELVVATDVSSPLSGPDGAARVYGPQKGADAAAVERLDAGLQRLAPLLGPGAAQPGAGAAGGLGAAFMALGAARASGARLILELTGFAAELAGADLCITAEGKVDRGTVAGKAVAAVLAACVESRVPCVILGGAITDDAVELYDRGAAAVLAIGSEPRSHDTALAATAVDLQRTARAVCTLAGQARQLARG